MRERLPLFAGLALLALAFVLGSYAIAGGIRNRNASNDVIVVTGSAKKRIVSDYVVWNLSVSSQQKSASGAAKELAGWTSTIRSFLRREGVESGELTVQPISTATVTRSGHVVAYRLSRRLEVRSARVQEVTDVADRSSALLAQGIPLAVQSPQYVYTKLPALRPQLLAEATKDAQNRARVIVEATGAHLGKLRGVDVGVFQVTSPNSTQVEDYGVYDTGTLEKDVTAVVNVTFALK
ncbi:MAG: SIMPL domain-containing protein [Gaiellaceae bacterium]